MSTAAWQPILVNSSSTDRKAIQTSRMLITGKQKYKGKTLVPIKAPPPSTIAPSPPLSLQDNALMPKQEEIGKNDMSESEIEEEEEEEMEEKEKVDLSSATPFDNFWSMEDAKVYKPTLLKQSKRKHSSRAFSFGETNNFMDNFSFNQFRECFANQGISHIGLLPLYKAWNLVKKLSELSEWISSVVQKDIGLDIISYLKDGEILCIVANAVKPGSIDEIQKDSYFGQLENITAFINVCKREFKLGYVFSEPDLLSDMDPPLVIDCLYSLAKAAHYFNSELPSLRLMLPDSKYSSHQISVAVDYTLRQRRHSDAIQ